MPASSSYGADVIDDGAPEGSRPRRGAFSIPGTDETFGNPSLTRPSLSRADGALRFAVGSRSSRRSTLVGNYILGEEIGKGAYGQVRRAMPRVPSGRHPTAFAVVPRGKSVARGERSADFPCGAGNGQEKNRGRHSNLTSFPPSFPGRLYLGYDTCRCTKPSTSATGGWWQ